MQGQPDILVIPVLCIEKIEKKGMEEKFNRLQFPGNFRLKF